MSKWLKFSLLVAIAGITFGDGNTNGFISFETEHAVVAERAFETVSLFFVRKVGTTGMVIVDCQIVNHTSVESDADFVQTSARVVLPSGSTRASCQFQVDDDNIPEVNETFTVALSVASGGAEVASPSMSLITILANDDPHGVIGFVKPGQVVKAIEPETGGTSVAILEVQRSGGNIGLTNVFWQVTSSPGPAGLDLFPTSGFAVFQDGQNKTNISISILPDDTPENEERFSIRLVNASNGAVLDDKAVETEVEVEKNDAPIRFEVALINFQEPQTQSIKVLRGIGESGGRVGPTDQNVETYYETVDGSAKENVDYRKASGSLSFQAGITERTISIEVLTDGLPEINENFTVRLFNVSRGLVLANPSVMVIEISKNDDPYGLISFRTILSKESAPVILDEDGQKTGLVQVNRTKGTFGTITVDWKVTRISNSTEIQLKDEVEPIQGTVTFGPGQAINNIQINAVTNNIPQVARAFIIELTAVSGGATLLISAEGTPKSRIIVADSDDAYGIVQFSRFNTSKVTLSTSPRRIDASLERSGGSLGEILVNYSAYYLLSGSSSPSSEVPLLTPGNIVMKIGEREGDITIHIGENGFLRSGSFVVITLLSASVTDSTLVPPSSPRIGTFRTLYVNITNELANGEIAFFNNPIRLTVEEPAAALTRPIHLMLLRDGTASAATVYWEVTGTTGFTSSDVRETSGLTSFAKGQDRANITVELMSDDQPELEETLIVELVNVTGRNERIRSGASTATIVIPRNDDPSGIFQFNGTTHIYLEEKDTSFAVLQVIRTKGALTKQTILLEIVKGADDFIYYRQALTFNVGQSSSEVFIFPRDDDIPEISENFTVKLTAVGDSIIGSNSMVNITILQNDDANGVISFVSLDVNLNKVATELKDSIQTVDFQLQRTRGTFGLVSVQWNTSSYTGQAAGLDIEPTSGLAIFNNGESTSSIRINIKRDELPEEAEKFSIHLVSVSGGARLSQPLSANLTIGPNDAAVSFEEGKTYSFQEGGIYNLSVRISRALQRDVVISYFVTPVSAEASDFQIVESTSVIKAGMLQGFIPIMITDDTIPEDIEEFHVTLNGSTEDTVLVDPRSANVQILGNDDAYGVFQFNANSLSIVGTEGQTVQLIIDRLKGTFRNATVSWVALANSTMPLPNNSEVISSSGSISFNAGEQRKPISVSLRADAIPELNETIMVKLVRVEGGQAPDVAKLGPANYTTAIVSILENDDPYGVLRFNPSSLQVSVAEDFLQGMERTTEANLTVSRGRGSFGTVEVLWEIFNEKESINLPLRIWDMFFHGQREPGVRKVPGRGLTGTSGYEFRAENKSYVFIQSKDLPPPSSNAFTVSLWISPQNGTSGTLLARADGGAFSLIVEITGHRLSASLSVTLAEASGRENVTITGAQVDNFFDGQWHSVVITANGGSLVLYLDASDGITRTLKENIGIIQGHMYIGCREPGTSHYNGKAQDVRLYTKALSTSEAKAIGTVTRALGPTNGYLQYQEHVISEFFTIRSVDNDSPEPDTVYNVKIIDVKGGARLDNADTTAKITILKSDFSNGQFGFVDTNCSMQVQESTGSVTFTIERSRSTFGGVTVAWVIVSANSSGTLAEADFVRAEGNVSFASGERQKTLTILVRDDADPEPLESFVITLASVVSDDGAVSSTPTSGASLRPNHTTCQLAIIENDYPYGLFQIMGSVPTNVTYIPPEPRPLNISVLEEVGRAKVFVARAQGVQGTVSCEWKTASLTALGGRDFQEAVGKVELKDGVNNTAVYITIIDNDVPELEKIFSISLFNPIGGAALGPAATAFVVIQPSDDAYGVFSFLANSSNISVDEANETRAMFTIERHGGTLGTVQVTWRINGSVTDFMASEGVVTFNGGEKAKSFQIPVINDEVAELDETFTVLLTSATPGRLSLNLSTAQVTILANDYPYGLFQFLPKVYTVKEGNTTIAISIFRSYGTLGDVRVAYESVPFPDVSYPALQDQDYSNLKGSVVFGANQEKRDINLTIFDDDLPEADEIIQVNLTSAALLAGPQSSSHPTIGKDRLALVTIEANDEANGILELSAASINISESFKGPFLNVTRRRGVFGRVSVRYRADSGSAVLGTDFSVTGSSIELEDQQRTAAVPITLFDDLTPELAETFTVELIPESVTGGASIGSVTKCLVTILESDYPYGRIGFAAESLNQTIEEPSGSSTTTAFTVKRTGGTMGPLQIEWNVSMPSMSALADVQPTSGNIRFLSGESEQTFLLYILPDDLPEYDEIFTVRLTAVVLGQAPIDPALQSATLVIPRNDEPHGVITFEQSQYTVTEDSVTNNLTLKVIRRRGLFGDLQITYRTLDATAGDNASPGSDYKPESGGIALMKNGLNFTTITLQIYADDIPELTESFRVQLVKVDLIGDQPKASNRPTIGSPDIANITIAENDSPYGLLGLELENGDPGSNGTRYTVYEPESGELPVTFKISRLKGDLGSVSVAWRVSANGSGFDINADVGSADGGRKEFLSGQRSKSFTITVKADNVPERDEFFEVELYDPKGGANIDASRSRVRVIINANDGVGGKIGFRPGSRSKVAQEGEDILFEVERLVSAAGLVNLTWTISGNDVASDFASTMGYLIFQDGQTLVSLHIKASNDLIPEVNERFIITLSNPITTGVSGSGAATLDPQSSIAILFLNASDDPHGVIGFVPLTKPTILEESTGVVQLGVLREKGKIGAVRVYYTAVGMTVNSSTTEAESGKDFLLPSDHFVMLDGQDSYNLNVTIVDDDVPEQNEAFQVNLTRVELLNDTGSTILPRLGEHTFAEIIITANDGTQGELAFEPYSERPTIQEGNYVFNLTVHRYKGTFGNVYAFYYVNQLTAGPEDFFIEGGAMTGPARLEFADRESTRNISVQIKDDNITENYEQFEVVLTIQNAIGNGGVVIGKPDRALVTIAPSDDANGVFFFADGRTAVIEEPESEGSSKSSTSLAVRRDKGVFGTVIIGWRVRGSVNNTDLSSTSGSLDFQENDRERFIRIEAVKDNIPELNKTYTIEIFVISGNGRIGQPSMTNVTILANDNPYGAFSISILPSLTNKINVNENVGLVHIRVIRSGGAYGQVSVKYKLVPGTAAASSGTSWLFHAYQTFQSLHARSFHAFQAHGIHYLLVAYSGAENLSRLGQSAQVMDDSKLVSTLLRWQGVYVPIKMIYTYGAVRWITFNITDKVFMGVCNYGESGKHETTSQIFELTLHGDVMLVQNITTQGAADMVTFEDGGNLYLVVANQRDNNGNTLVRSKVYRWSSGAFVQQGQGIETQGASDLETFSTNGVQYLAIVNSYDPAGKNTTADTVLYQWDADNTEFKVLQRIEVEKGQTVGHMKQQSDDFLIVASGSSGILVYKKTTGSSKFALSQTLAIKDVKNAEVFVQESTNYLIVTAENSLLLKWEPTKEKFEKYQVLDVQNPERIEYLDLEGRNPTSMFMTVSNARNSGVYEGAMISNESDVAPREGELIFYPNDKRLDIQFTILIDKVPERDETFQVSLSDATGGAVLSTDASVSVTILSNDNAYGRIKFMDKSLLINVSELSYDNPLNLELVREFGTFGQLLVTWNLSTPDGQKTSDIEPSAGQVAFLEGAAKAVLSLTVKMDATPELDEQFKVILVSVQTSGIADPNSGATINLNQNVATVTILANDDPHGVVGWKNRVEVTTEGKEINSSAVLVIERKEGTYGDIMVTYQTVVASTVSEKERPAIPGIDFFPLTSSIVIKEGEKEVYVLIHVRHDNITSVNEVFYVNITGVSLVGSRPPIGSPRVDDANQQVEVVITEEIFERGVLEFAGNLDLTVNEDAGTLLLPLHRFNGSQGTVSLHFEVVSINSSASDYSPQNGVISFASNVTRRNIEVQIVKDNIPELAELFMVRLTKPVGGLRIGNKQTVRITIAENDFPYGLMRFRPTSPAYVVTEGNFVELTIERLQGTFRSTEVLWTCDVSAGADLSPRSGSIVFSGMERNKTIQIKAVDDAIPELDETFTCFLSSATNGAVISADNATTLTVLGNDKPYGIINIHAEDRSLVVSEPDSPGQTGIFHLRLQRLIGFVGKATVHWQISPDDGGEDDASRTFNVTSGATDFLPGQSMEMIAIQVIDDNNPEESRRYSLTLIGVSTAELDNTPNTTRSHIIVTASENPYGTVEFDEPLSRNVSEDVGTVSVIVRRKPGLIAKLVVLFNVTSASAVAEKDFSPASGEITIDSAETAVLTLKIFNDTIPEIKEVLTITLTSVRVITSKQLDFSTVNGRQIDIPPRIGNNRHMYITIDENDFPYGVIGFLQSSVLVREWDGVIEIPVNRSGGSFGTSEVTYSATALEALPGTDFVVEGDKLTFLAGETQKKIVARIIDDAISEFQERFTISLRSVQGGASLGPIQTVTVTIETSDNPNGLFGLYNSSRNVFVPNPSANVLLSFPLQRVGGALGDILVKWRLIRTASSTSAITEDIQPADGSLFFSKGDHGPQPINVTVLTYPGPQEIEETFILNVHSTTGGAAIDQLTSNITITVGKKGHPNGLFVFSGDVSPGKVVLEPSTGVTTVFIPVLRMEGSQGVIEVRWAVQDISGRISSDLILGTNPVKFQNGQTSANIELNVTADLEPEVDEVYHVFIESVTNNADIGLRRNISFTISANDNPHGIFMLLQPSVGLRLDPDTLARVITVGVQRSVGGAISVVKIDFSLRFSWYESTSVHSVSISDGARQAELNITIPDSKFLMWNGSFTVRIESVSASPASTMPPSINPAMQQITISIPEETANAVVEFNSSYTTSIRDSDGSATAVITRRGLFGSITVLWESGYGGTSPPSGLTVGPVVPVNGQIDFKQGERSKELIVKVLVPGTLAAGLVYAVSLSPNLSPTQPQKGWATLGAIKTTNIEPHGVLEVAPVSRVTYATEGTQAPIIVRRLFSTLGVVGVNYSTTVATGANSAIPGVDFVPMNGYLEFLQGQYEKTALVTLLEDNGQQQAERNEIFYVDLTATSLDGQSKMGNSPRFNGQTRAVVTIQDNDDPYGVIGFDKAESSVLMKEGTSVKLKIHRKGGAFSAASVLVRSLGGGEAWESQVLDGLATLSPIKQRLQSRIHTPQVTRDYAVVNQIVHFPELTSVPVNGQQQEIEVSVLQDSLAEPPEEFFLILSNATGGARTAGANDPLLSYANISIEGNGLWNGQVGFTVQKGELDEDGTAKASFPVERFGERSQSIQVTWAVYPDNEATRRLLERSGTLTLSPTQTAAIVNLELRLEEVPQFATWFWLNITSVSEGAQILVEKRAVNVTILESDYPAGRLAFDPTSRFPIVNLGDTRHQLVVRRYNGTLSDITVKYQTVTLPGVVTQGGVSLIPAVANADFTIASETLTFPKGRTEAYINLQLTPLKASKGSYPKIFNVTLVEPSNGGGLFEPYSSASVIISDKSQTSQFLRLYSDTQVAPLEDKEIESILSQLLALVSRPPLTTDDQNLAMNSIRAITSYKASRADGERGLTLQSQETLLKIFDSLLDTSRTDTRAVSAWAKLLEETVYHFLSDQKCPTSIRKSLSNFEVEIERNNGSNFNGKKFMSGNGRDFLRYPINLFPTVGKTSCTDMHFIDYGNRQWFRTAANKAILSDKVVSSAIKDKPALSFKVIYRIHAPQTRVTPTGVSCAIWKYPTLGSAGDWEATNCKVKGETESYVECECQHLSEYAVLAQSDDRTGYAIYFYVACFVCIGACFLALAAHHICALETTFSANLLMHMFFSIMVSNVLFVTSAYLSPSLMTKYTECAILGLFIHFFLLSQFTWIFSQACNLWYILVMNDEHTYRKLILFFLLGWGLPVLVVVVYIFLTVAIWGWEFTMMYGDVHKNGDLCFMANSYAAFGSVLIPVLLLLIGAIGVFVQAYQVTPQWRCYDDIYRERYNIKEVRNLMVLYFCLAVTWLFAALHVIYGYLWMIITFTALNFILGLYIFTMYALLRNQMRYIYKRKYPVRTMPPMITTENFNGLTASHTLSPTSRKIAESRQRLDLNEWEDVDFGNMTPLPDHSPRIRLERYSPFPVVTPQNQGAVNQAYEEDDLDSQDLDDLIFALKTGGRLSPSNKGDMDDDIISIPAFSSDHYEMRRIEIADTHL